MTIDDQIEVLPPATARKKEYDARRGAVGYVCKPAIRDLRGFRAAVLQAAIALARNPELDGMVLVLPRCGLDERLLKEDWATSVAALNPSVRSALRLIVQNDSAWWGEPLDPRSGEIEEIQRLWGASGKPGIRDRSPAPSWWIITHILLARWQDRAWLSVSELAAWSAHSHPTVLSAIRGLGDLIERNSSRKVRLRQFPHRVWDKFSVLATTSRETVRFVDRSGQPRQPERLARRLGSLHLPQVAVGGVLGARHHLPSLDLLGTPRLDLSVHAPNAAPDLAFVEKLDPALERTDDINAPCSVAVHRIRRSEAWFSQGEHHLWADPMECLLDLQELKLDAATQEFLDWLKRNQLK